MPTSDIPTLVAIFLPYDHERASAAYEDDPDIEVPAASLASFSVAAKHAISTMDPQERQEFCERVAARADQDVAADLVEAVLRSIEGDPEALTGTDPGARSACTCTGWPCSALNTSHVSSARTYAPTRSTWPRSSCPAWPPSHPSKDQRKTARGIRPRRFWLAACRSPCTCRTAG